MSVDDLIKKARKEARQKAENDNPRHRRNVHADHPQAFLDARADFEKRWDAIHKEGEEKGYLVWSGGYEGEWVVDHLTTYENGSEWAETEAEHRARVTRAAGYNLSVRLDRGLR